MGCFLEHGRRCKEKWTLVHLMQLLGEPGQLRIDTVSTLIKMYFASHKTATTFEISGVTGVPTYTEIMYVY